MKLSDPQQSVGEASLTLLEQYEVSPSRKQPLAREGVVGLSGIGCESSKVIRAACEWELCSPGAFWSFLCCGDLQQPTACMVCLRIKACYYRLGCWWKREARRAREVSQERRKVEDSNRVGSARPTPWGRVVLPCVKSHHTLLYACGSSRSFVSFVLGKVHVTSMSMSLFDVDIGGGVGWLFGRLAP